MEKKINKNFYLLSSINIISALILGGGFTIDSLALVAVLAVLVLNHYFLVSMVVELTASMSDRRNDAGSPVKKILFLLFIKMSLLAAVLCFAYFYDKNILPKVFLMMIFQLIIQVLSIKNNHLKS